MTMVIESDSTLFMNKSKTFDVLNGYFTDVLFSVKDKKFYIGSTNNLERRLTEHFSGRVSSTKFRIPLKLIYYEYFINQKDAKSREIFLKSGFGRSQLKIELKTTLISFKTK